MLMAPFAIVLTLNIPATISARKTPISDINEIYMEMPEPEHSHGENKTAMLEYGHLDVTVPTITGGFVECGMSRVLLKVANKALCRWWESTPLGHRSSLPELCKRVFGPDSA